MPHDKATPHHERPTLESLRIQVNMSRNHDPVCYQVDGNWETNPDGTTPEFSVRISGHPADVDEVIESLKINGNLHNLKFRKVIKNDV